MKTMAFPKPYLQQGIFNLAPLGQALPSPVAAIVRSPLEKLLSFPAINDIYDRIFERVRGRDPSVFCEAVLETLNITLRLDDAALAEIPRTGPVVAVANHPYGGIEGMILGAILFRARPDVRLIVNELLACIPEMHPMCFFVNVFGSDQATAANTKALKGTLAHLRRGGCLGVFPAGAVSHLHMTERRVSDPAWSPHIAALIRRTGASVVPIYFPGRNGAIFQFAGMLHPRLRTALLPRELANKAHMTCRVQIGSVISPDEMKSFETDEQAIQYVRHRTYALAERMPVRARLTARFAAPLKKLALWPRRSSRPVAAAVAADAIEGELNRLDPDALLACTGDLCVYLAPWQQLDATAQELGRLREISFRSVGEGTGREIDLDQFDPSYLHLLVWNRQTRELVGGYRMGLVDQITRGRGIAGMYLSTLFDFAPNFLERLGPAMELGRSFVRPEYQKSFSALMLLWKGIGQFVARNPRYRTLVGPVSISSRYTIGSRAVMYAALSGPRYRSPLASLVTPRSPFHPKPKQLGKDVDSLGRLVRDLDELVDVVGDMEPDGKSVPILLKQYLKLGGKTLAFNVDPAFNHCLDCLLLVDLLHADTRQVQRYMGKPQAQQFYAAHAMAVADELR